MEVLRKIKKLESLHILLWLIKDSSWMLEFEWFSIIMIFPTLFVAIIIVYHSFKTKEVFLNLSVFCWILANSIWMYNDFFNDGDYKFAAGVLFVIGILFILYYYYKIFFKTNAINKS